MPNDRDYLFMLLGIFSFIILKKYITPLQSLSTPPSSVNNEQYIENPPGKE